MSPLPGNITAIVYDYDFAINLYSQVISSTPQNVSAFNNRGICLVKKAIEAYDVRMARQGCGDIETAILLSSRINDQQRPICIQALAWAKNVIEVLENI